MPKRNGSETRQGSPARPDAVMAVLFDHFIGNRPALLILSTAYDIAGMDICYPGNHPIRRHGYGYIQQGCLLKTYW
jgi:hypothetical protein